MRIAIPSDDQQNISAHFGRTKGFLIYEVEDQQIKNRVYRPNTFTGHAQGLHLEPEHHHGHGHSHGHSHGHNHNHDHGGIMSALADCETVIARGMGRRLLINFEEEKKNAFITKITLADEAVNTYLAGELQHDASAACEH